MIFISILLYIAGIIAFIIGGSKSPEYVTQQTIQYLIYLSGTIFIAAGSIVLAITVKSNSILDSLDNIQRLSQNSQSNNSPTNYSATNDSTMNDNTRYSSSSPTTWKCKKCGTENPFQASTCKGCGEYK